MAAAILDFWTYDLVAIAERLQRGEGGLHPRLFERPVLRFGATFVQLPWVVGTQNNSTAAINNLRRLGSRRTEARDETQQIETRLADLLRGRDFRVVTNWNPPADAKEAGEVDLIAARDGQERELADKYRGWAEALQYSHPYVASKLLMGLVRTYEHDARREDTDAIVQRRLR